MNEFSILLIENQLLVTATIVQHIAEHLTDYQLSIVRDIAEAVAETGSADVILLNIRQLADDVSGRLSSLTTAYPDRPIILLQEVPAGDEREVEEEIALQALTAAATDYVALSEIGLLVLGRRLIALQRAWQNQPPHDGAAIPLSFSEPFDTALAGDATQLAVQLIGPDNRIRVWNRVAETFFGLKPEEALGSPVEDLALSADNLSRLKDILDHVRLIGQPFSIPHYPLENQSGAPRWIRVYVYPIPGPQAGAAETPGLAVGLISVDVTDLKQAETQHWHDKQELQILLETSHEISAELELKPTLEKIGAQLKHLLSVDNCHIYFLEKDNQTLQAVISIGPYTRQVQKTRLKVGSGLVGSSAASGKAMMINFAHQHGETLYGSRVKVEAAADEHLLCAPLTARKGIIGLIIVSRSQPPFVKEEFHFFETLVHQASTAINNARLFEETQRSLIELEILYEASTAISTTWETQQVLDNLIRQMVQALNVSYGHIASWHQEQSQGDIRAQFSSDDFTATFDKTELALTFNLTQRPALVTVINQQRPVFFQLSNPALDAAERKDMEKHGCLSRLLVPLVVKRETIGWAELWETRREYLFTANEIRLVRMLANQVAVTLENAEYLRQTQRTLEEMTALYEVASALATTQDSQTVITIVLQEYLRVLGLKQGSVIIFDFEAKQGVVKVNLQDDQPAITNSGNETGSHLYGSLEGRQISLENDSIYRDLMRTHRPIMIEEAQAERLTNPSLAPPLAAATTSAGWASPTTLSLLIIPLQIRGAIIGAVVAEDTRRQRAFDQWEISLGQAMADQLGLALQNAQLYESEYERRRQAETLREVSSVVGSSLNLNEVLERIMDQLGRVVKYDSAAIHLIEGKRRRIIAGRGFRKPDKVMGITFPAQLDKNEPGSIVIHTRQPLVSGNISERYKVFKQPEHSDIKSWMGIPLIARDKVIGLITIDRTEPNVYTDEDAQLAMAFANQVAIALENARLHEIEVRELERELQIAQGIQKTLLPQSTPQVPGLQIFGRSIPARQIGGDFFHFFSIRDDQLGVAIGDVSGKGIPAALYMAATITAIDTKIREELTPSELLNHLNQTLYNRLRENKMNIGLQIATFAPLPPSADNHGQIEKKARGSMVTVGNAGMIAPIGATRHGCRFLPVSGLPVGSIPAPEQIYREDLFLLDPFTTIIFSSDGIVEAQNESGELFGFERLEQAINEIIHTRDAKIIADHLIETAQKFMGSTEQNDDMTVVVVVKL